jgi:hypothetical protein
MYQLQEMRDRDWRLAPVKLENNFPLCGYDLDVRMWRDGVGGQR